MSKVNKVRAYLLKGVAKQAGVEALEAQLEEARGGMYACMMQSAIVAGSKEAWLTEVETLEADFRANKRGIAVKFNCERAVDKDGNDRNDANGKPVYRVPSSLSTAKSVIGQAIDRDIDLGTEKKPESFGAVRTANRVAKEAEQKAALSGEDKRKAEAAQLLTETAELIGGIEGKAFTALLKLIKALHKAAATAASESEEKAAA
jgi:hypothetical protein